MFADFWDMRGWHWEVWGPAACGVLAAVLVMIIGMLMLRRRRRHNLFHFSQPSASIRASLVEDDPFIHGSALERRKALRRGGNPIAVLLTDADIKGKPVSGWVVDRSTGGLCLSVPEAVETGTVLSVRTANAPESVPWIQIEVKNCRQADGNWELGCQFVRTPPWSVLLLFG